MMLRSVLKPAKTVYFLLLDRLINKCPPLYRLLEKLRVFIMYYKIDESLRVVRSNTKPGDTVYDIGAHIGLYSICLVNYVNNAKLFAFEPQPNIYRKLTEKIRLFKYEKSIIPMECALGTDVGKIPFYISSNPGQSSFYKSNAESGQQVIDTVQVNCYTIDYLVEHQIIDAPDLIKIDTEGNELKVLNGSKNTLSKHHPKIVLEPHTSIGSGYTVEELKQWLSTFGYKSINYDHSILFR